MKLILEALQANDGDRLLLHHQNGTATTRVLIDGGARSTGRSRGGGSMRSATGSGSICGMLMVSHIDADHITGLVDMFRAMKKEEDTARMFCRDRTLWFNLFEKLTGGKAAAAQSASSALNGVVPAGLAIQAVASVQQGHDLRNPATTLAIPMNQGRRRSRKAPKKGVKKLTIAKWSRFAVLGPSTTARKSLTPTGRQRS